MKTEKRSAASAPWLGRWRTPAGRACPRRSASDLLSSNSWKSLIDDRGAIVPKSR